MLQVLVITVCFLMKTCSGDTGPLTSTLSDNPTTSLSPTDEPPEKSSTEEPSPDNPEPPASLPDESPTSNEPLTSPPTALYCALEGIVYFWFFYLIVLTHCGGNLMCQLNDTFLILTYPFGGNCFLPITPQCGTCPPVTPINHIVKNDNGRCTARVPIGLLPGVCCSLVVGVSSNSTVPCIQQISAQPRH